MEPVLLVEDKDELRAMLVTALKRMGYDPVQADALGPALAALRSRRFAAVLTDLKLPGGSGRDVLKAALEADVALPVVIMTAYGTVADAVAAMREGAYDFIQKPIDLEHLQHLLQRAIERQQLLRENIVLKEEYARQFGFPRIVGEHPAMQAAAREMQRVASTESTVLLLGESGTGKELFARAIHRLSPRASRPFVALNCAAIPETLIENELFGHERGAYTGANTRQTGKFELAHGGTIFLDEIAELPPSAQAKLLRVLEEHVVERLGGARPLQVDVRVIAATNRDLEKAVAAGDFRSDLYYRLAVCPIRIPALRERGDDIALIAEHFVDRFRHELRKPHLTLAREALTALRAYPWPGNVRELQNVIERAAILNDGELTAESLAIPPGPRAASAAVAASAPDASLPAARARAVEELERARIESTLKECKWNKAQAAQRLGISYKTLLNKIHAYGLD
jgi:DNA-binding NtrC family response regulator